MQLHGFCDASEVAYSGVVYVRAIDDQGEVHLSLVMSKTKVAPIKQLSIPRLDIMWRFHLSQVTSSCSQDLGKCHFPRLFAWTDSCITLGWLQGNPRRFLAFVGNRVAEISEAIPVACWGHVKGVDNPADSASRGMFPVELVGHDGVEEGT